MPLFTRHGHSDTRGVKVLSAYRGAKTTRHKSVSVSYILRSATVRLLLSRQCTSNKRRDFFNSYLHSGRGDFRVFHQRIIGREHVPIIGHQRWVLVDTGLSFTAVSKTLFIERFVRVWVHEAR